MALSYTPMTELEAVNIMLLTVGEQPVNQLEDTGLSIVTIARDVLHRINRSVQSAGLECNQDHKYKLVPDVNKYINIPANCLRIDRYYADDQIVQRGTKLYNKAVDKQTDKFDDPVYVDITWFLPWTDLPNVVREYLTIRAARVFHAKVLGADQPEYFSKEEEAKALSNLIQQQIDAGNYSIWDNYDVNKIVSRAYNPVKVTR